ncbi:MAG: hypothetical protein IJR59_02130 [Firmicutes bacterium]|nr:hypothetical protein [Bacillota bacterium]
MTPEHFRNLMIGIILVLGAILTASYSLTESNNWKHVQNGAGKTRGVITDIYAYNSGAGSRMAVEVAYEADGVPYNSNLATYTSDMEIGKEIPIYYLKSDPAVTISRPRYIDILYALAGTQLILGVLILVIDPEF